MTPSPTARRRFLAGLGLATLLVFVAGDERVRLDVRGCLNPDALAQALLVADPDRGTRQTVELDATVWRPLLEDVHAAGGELFATTTSRVEASAGHTSERRRSALVTLDAHQGDERIAWRVFGEVLAGRREVSSGGFMPIPAHADRLSVSFRTRPGTGRFRFATEPVRLMVRDPAYPAIVVATALVWTVLAAALLSCLWRRSGALRAAGALGVLAAVTIGVSVSEATPLQGLRPAADLIASVATRVPGGMLGLFKAGHLLVFLGVGAVAGLCRPTLGASLMQTALALLLLACASEALQLHLVDRTAAPLDVAIDLTGALSGLVAVQAVTKVRRRAGARPGDQDTRERPAR